MASILPETPATMKPMTHAPAQPGSGRARIGVGMLWLLLIPWAPALAQRAELPPDDAAGDVWRLVHGGGGLTSPGGKTGLSLESVAASGELFVAVGEEGTILRSSDGNNWSAARCNLDARFTEVIWGGGRFVALGDLTIASSNDGDSWESSRTPRYVLLNGVAWGDGRFVAAGFDGAIVQSRDGRRWQPVLQRATRASLYGIAWGGGRFVAVGSDGVILYSADGEHWQTARDGGTSTLYDVVYNGERFVAVGTGIILRSSDGERWDLSRSDLPHPEPLNDVVWSGERFVAVGDSILHSSDGDRWETATVEVEGEPIETAGWVWSAGSWRMSDDWDYRLDGIAWNGAGFVAVGQGGAILVSGDGLHWEQASDSRALLPELVGVAWGGERFVAVAGWPDSIVLHSADGQRWQHASVGSDSDANRYGSNRYGRRGLNDVVWAGDRFVAVGATIASSADGDRWQELLLPLEGTLNAVAWNGQDLVAVGDGGTIIRRRYGDRWPTVVDSGTSEPLNDVVWGGERFVAVGNRGVIVHSDDGDHWRPASRPAVPVRIAQPDEREGVTYYGFRGVAWNGERFVAVGWGGGGNRVGTVVHSRDGDRWELAADHDFLTAEHFEAVAWNGRRFVAVSSFDGTTMYSADGDRWETASESATFDALRDVAWGNGRFVAVGWNGTIVVSP